MEKNRVSRQAGSVSTAVRLAVAASMFGLVSGAYAASTVSSIALVSGVNGGTVDSISLDNDARTIDLNKSFTTVDPLTIRVTVAHTTGTGNPYEWSETITNNTNEDWTDYHFTIIEPDPSNGVTFNAFQQSTLDGFTLDSPPVSGPRNLNFTGNLAMGNSTEATFLLSMPDPGQGNTYTFDLVQLPTTTGTAPIPLPPAAWLMGSAIAGVFATRARRPKVV